MGELNIRKKAGRDFFARLPRFPKFRVVDFIPKAFHIGNHCLVDIHDVIDIPRFFAEPHLQPRAVGDRVAVLRLDAFEVGKAFLVHDLRYRMTMEMCEKILHRKLLYVHNCNHSLHSCKKRGQTAKPALPVTPLFSFYL